MSHQHHDGRTALSLAHCRGTFCVTFLAHCQQTHHLVCFYLTSEIKDGTTAGDKTVFVEISPTDEQI